jgi:hypothetical protein
MEQTYSLSDGGSSLLSAGFGSALGVSQRFLTDWAGIFLVLSIIFD